MGWNWWHPALCLCAAIGSGACRDHCGGVIAGPDVALCLESFRHTRDPGLGARIAATLLDGAGDPQQLEHLATEVGDAPEGAGAWNALGEARLRRGEPGAVEPLLRALSHRAAGDTRGRVLDARALYRAYAAANAYADALHYAALAYDELTRLEDPELRGKVLTGVTVLLYDIGALSSAEAVMAQADAAIEDPSPAVSGGAADDAARIWASLREVHGLVELAHGRYRRAAHELGRALGFARARGLDDVVHDALDNLVEAELASGDVDAAAHTLRADVAAGDPEWHAVHAVLAARIALAQGDAPQATAIVSAALAEAPEDWIQSLEAVRGRALARSGQPVEAEHALLHSIERIEIDRAGLGLDVLKPWVLAQLRQPFDDLFALYVQHGRGVDALALVQQATARSTLEGLLEIAEPRSPRIAVQIDRAGERAAGLLALVHSMRSSHAAPPPEIHRLLAMLGTCRVLTYFAAGDQLWLLVAYAGDVKVFPLGPVATARREIAAWLAAPAQGDLAASVAARILPDAALGDPGAPLYVASDPSIRDLPFAALRVDNHYLVERNPISYIPSASVLVALSSAPHHHGPVLVIGDPTASLPSARREAIEIAGLLGVEPAVGAAATKARLLSARGDEVLHVAAHTEPTARGPALMLADGPVLAGDVIDHGVGADVVILTSCSTADPGNRDELRSLAHAFVATGSHAVVASLRPIEDGLALRFARLFYAAGGVADPIRGVARAQLRLMAEGVPVAFWSSFVVYGEGASPKLTRKD